MRAVLGVDTSCYTSSVACVDEAGGLLYEKRRLLTVRQGARGLQQSEAVFQHTVNLPLLLEEMAGHMPKTEWMAVCASLRPRPADDSYMPVFQAGAGYARAVAALFHVPFIPTTHQEGHIRAAKVGVFADQHADPSVDLTTGKAAAASPDKLLVFHLSGGTTELLAVAKGRIELVCATADLHAGQLVDRVGVALGLGFPAGPGLEQLAIQGQARALVPVSVRDGQCHLSGAERQLLDMVGNAPGTQVAAEVYSFLCRTIQRMIAEGVRLTGFADVLLAGGVASSALLRTLLTERVAARQRAVRLHFARPELAGDNAVGVALLGLEGLGA